MILEFCTCVRLLRQEFAHPPRFMDNARPKVRTPAAQNLI